MTVNDAMLAVAQNLAQKYGYIEVEASATHNALNDQFWGNVAIGIAARKSGQVVDIKTCRYIIPTFEEEKIGGCNGNPRIHIDMFWGKPRLNISLPDKTFACLTYEASALSEAQAFGPAGLELAAEVKKQIDSLLD